MNKKTVVIKMDDVNVMDENSGRIAALHVNRILELSARALERSRDRHIAAAARAHRLGLPLLLKSRRELDKHRL
jgi:hypothetical protein